MTSPGEVPTPTRDRLFQSLKAMAAALAGRTVLLTGIFLAIVVAVFWWPDWWPELRDRFTPRFDGQIIVNSPAVYTRQRLVNDRLSQSAWLQEQLRVTTREFDATFRSIDEVRTIRNSSSLRTQIGVGSGAAAGAASGGTSAPADDTRSDAAAPTVTPTSADLFRAKNTYREEVRNEIMETELDDRHDIQGNTIYRLSFDATVLPGTRTDALAVTKVKVLHDHTQAEKVRTSQPATKGETPRPAEPIADAPLDREYFQLYEDWLNFMQKTVQNSVTNIAQTLYERAPDNRVAQALPIFLLKRICELTYNSRGNPSCDPAVYPDRDSTELKVASKTMADFIAAYLAARRAIFLDQLRLNIITAAKKFNKTPESFLYAFDESYQFCKQAQRNFYKTDWSTGYALQVSCPVVNGPFEGVIGAIILYNELAKTLPETAQDAQAVISGLLETIKRRCPGEEKATCNLPDTTKENLRCLAADYMWSQLNLHDRRSESNLKFSSNQRFDRYFRVHLVGRETGMCNVIFLAKERSVGEEDAVSNMRRDLNSGVEIYAYSITPKNLAQRLSTASDSRDAIQALLNANFSAGSRDVSSLVEALQKKSIQSQAIQALPIVVGYGLAPASSEEPPYTPYTEFGWVILPQIKIGTQNERSHSDRQYALAAVISVPSWWRSMTLTIETCWMDRADLHKQKQLKQCDTDAGPVRHTVRLPGVIAELSHKLGFEFVPEPRLEYRYPEDAPLKLEIGRPAQVLLMGGRIWRSTEVTLGAQKADEISVLPNMEGILAKFRCVRRQLGEEVDKPAVVPIRVWTSEGVTGPEYAQLVEPPVTDETKDKRAEMCPEERTEMQAPAVPKDAPAR